jgi:hypothetical protein
MLDYTGLSCYWLRKALNKSHKKRLPEDLKIDKPPLSLYPMKFDEVVDILLATKPKKYELKKRLKPVSRQISRLSQPECNHGEGNE